MNKKTTLTLAGVATSFIALIGIISLLARGQVIGKELAILMCVAVFGLYLGFGILIVVYRLVLTLR